MNEQQTENTSIFNHTSDTEWYNDDKCAGSKLNICETIQLKMVQF